MISGIAFRLRAKDNIPLSSLSPDSNIVIILIIIIAALGWIKLLKKKIKPSNWSRTNINDNEYEYQ